jgi:DMSO/TMAO reductase YedYZ molybdopterin-dependent catalytic subunit
MAATLAAALTVAFRAYLHVRTVPERLMEWLLLFVPLDLFEAVLQRWGFSAKLYAFAASTVLIFVLLSLLGAFLLRERARIRVICAAGLWLWLFTMVVVMPLTSAGYFASDLVVGRDAAILSHLAVALLFALYLVGARALGHQRLVASGAVLGAVLSRRAVLLVAAGGAFVLVASAILDAQRRRVGGVEVALSDPQEPVPSGGLDPPNPHPQMTLSSSTPTTAPTVETAPEPSPTIGASTGSIAESGATPPVSALPTTLPTPLRPTSTPRREPTRDKDGAVMTSGRRRGELAELMTSNADFYIVSKNAVSDPDVAGRDWRLLIDGEVQKAVSFDYESLRNLPAVELNKTVECISNLVAKCELAPFGCDLISTARWKGARLSDVLALAGGVKPGVMSIAAIAADEFTTSIPLEVAMASDTLLVYEMNGEPLPREHGFPARLLIPGRYGMKSTKWVVALRAMRREFIDWYGQRDWSRHAIVKTMTRIDVPAAGSMQRAGDCRVAGVAYAGDRGISRVEVSADGGRTWQPAEVVEPAPGRDAWVRWQTRVALAPGQATVMSRATDGTGALQPAEFSLAQPDGAAGWHAIDVRVASA